MPFSNEFKEAYWKDYVSRTESYEARTIYALQIMFMDQKNLALARWRTNPTKNTRLFDRRQAKKEYHDSMMPILSQVIQKAIENGQSLLVPENPHKDGIPPILNAFALAWLNTRIGWAADQIGEESASQLADILAAGYEQGKSVDQIAQDITGAFDMFSATRAERIARTEIMQASAEGTIEGYKESGVVTKSEFYTALDERVCEDCNSFNEEVFDLEETTGMIPLHPMCRCVWLPVVD